MNKQEIRERIKRIIIENPNDFTLSLKSLRMIKRGYAVAVTDRDNDKFNSLDDNLNELFIVIESFKQMKNLYVGGWSCKGKYYLDLTIICSKKERAFYLMSKFNQKSMFFIDDKKQINNKFYRGVVTL